MLSDKTEAVRQSSPLKWKGDKSSAATWPCTPFSLHRKFPVAWEPLPSDLWQSVPEHYAQFRDPGRYSDLMNQVVISRHHPSTSSLHRNRCFNPKGFQRTLNTSDKPAVFFSFSGQKPRPSDANSGESLQLSFILYIFASDIRSKFTFRDTKRHKPARRDLVKLAFRSLSARKLADLVGTEGRTEKPRDPGLSPPCFFSPPTLTRSPPG